VDGGEGSLWTVARGRVGAGALHELAGAARVLAAPDGALITREGTTATPTT